MRTRWIAAAIVLSALAGCQPGTQPPTTAAPPAASSRPVANLALPPPDRAGNYDAAVEPVDETRTPEKVAPKAVISKATAAQAAERTKRQAEADKKAKALETTKETATAKVEAPPASTGTTSSLSLPLGGGSLPLPKPIRDGRRSEPSRPGANGAMPPSMERPELPKVAAVAEPARPAPTAPAPPKAPPAAEQAPRPEPAAVPAPSPSPPPTIEHAGPKVAGTAPAPSAPSPSAPSPRQPPSGPPLGTVAFDPHSAELSNGMRAALAFFARDANAQGVRQVELWASSSEDDPVVARKVALARALAVHAYLNDVGLKARLDIGGYTDSHEGGADRVDLLIPKR